MAACGAMETRPGIVRLPRTPEMERAFGEAENLFLAKKYPEAVASYQDYLQRFPYNYYTPKAYYRMGEVELVGQRWREAILQYRESLKKGIFPEWGERAVYQMAVAYYRLGDYKNTYPILDQFPRGADTKLRVKAGSLRVAAAKKGKEPLEEVKGYLELVDAYSRLPAAERQTGELTWLVSFDQTLQSLRDWVNDSAGAAGADPGLIKGWKKRFSETSGGYLLWKLAKISYQKGDYRKAADFAHRYLEKYPKHEFVPSARLLLAELEKRETGIKPRIGVILPLTGEYAVYGESALHGMECAAGIFSPCHGDSLVLEVRDTGGDPATAVRRIRELAGDPEVAAIVGPLTQVEADEAARVAEELQIPLMALTQKPGIAEAGEYVFRNFLTVADEVATLVDYACREKKIRDFAILYPQNQGGEESLRHFEEEVGRCGGELVAKEGYPPGAGNFLDELRRLKFANGHHEIGENPPFEALFFPELYLRVPDLLQAIRFLKLNGIQLLGGPGWDHPDLAKTEGVEGAIFVNGFFPHSGDFATRDFAAAFQSAFGVEPTLLEAYSYDSFRLLASLLEGRSAVTRPEVQAALTSVRNFDGVTGDISFDETGDARRKLFLLTVQEGEVREVR